MPYHKTTTQHGFTIQEMLIVVAISVILLAVSVVGIVTYMRHLQLAELDNAAKEIFMAAQNRAILLSGGQRLEDYVVKADGANRMENVEVVPDTVTATDGSIQITAYYIHCDDENIDQLLPRESIDPTLWDGDFYIIYEPESGSVVDVFYSSSELPEAEDDFPAFYQQWRAAAKSARMESRPMIGYYGGEAAQSGTTISLRTPVINIYNENTLRVEVTYWVPRTFTMIGEGSNVSMTVTMDYQDQSLTLVPNAAGYQHTSGITYIAYTYTWVLDSIYPSQTHFRDLFTGATATGLTYGDDFTITAEVSYSGSALKVNGARKSATDNSLFAAGSGESTANIACLRHLQNLDTAFSGVSGKTAAVQTGPIPELEDYVFQPIENEDLQSYDGGEFPIYGLDIHSGGENAAGLFGAFSGTGATSRKTLENIRLVNTAVTGGNSGTGALVGSGSHLTFTNCQVYWENRSEQATNLRDVLGSSDTQFNYQVTGSGAVGGLAGNLTDATITGCSASTLVSGSGDTSAVGGLVGSGSSLTIDHSYAASYLRGPRAAGLIGNLTGSADISASYAVGFIDSGKDTSAQAAGLCLGQGGADVKSSYSAMLFTAGNTVTNYPLCETKKNYTNTYYLESDRFGFSEDTALAKSYTDLTDPAKWDALFGEGTFTSKTTAQSHPYNLQTTLSLTSFIYPGLADLEHWGDWGAQFQNGSLVYYEKYDDGTYGFSGGDVSHLADNKLVVEDGYAVAYRGTESTSSINVPLKVTYETGSLVSKTWEHTYTESDMHVLKNVADSDGQEDDYYLLPLPDEIVNTEYAAKDFYQKIIVEDKGNQITRSYYYNPHFANPVLREENGKNPAENVAQLQVIVRSPRHLYMLSQYEPYYASSNQYRFIQQLDLDYDVYTGYNLFDGNTWSQNPIGLSAAKPFRGNYYGECHSITGVTPTPVNGSSYVGLFGYSTGILRDIVYSMEKSDALAVSNSGSSSAALYAGALAGYNGGTISNCAVSGVKLEASGYEYSTIYLGGLVGINDGSIRSSAAEVAEVAASANFSNAYACGFVGRSTAVGIIDQCYAVGKVSASRARYGTVSACGFAGSNDGSLSRSYAAVSLSAEGGASQYGFCPDETTNCVYLDAGNFTYRGENYTAQYDDSHATSVTWAALTGQAGAEAAQTQAVNALNMAASPVNAHDNAQENYPYPGTVTDGNGQAIHYGQWPDRMDLGTMGVYYWEKLTIDGSSSYSLSAIFLTADGTVMKSGTLSTAHGDGGVVSDYGYGYFYQSGTAAPKLSSQNIYWNDDLFSPENTSTNKDADDALAALMSEQYTFRSYTTWQAEENAGLHMIVTEANKSSRQPPYGTWTLIQGNDNLIVRLTPFFADAMAVYLTSEQTAAADVPTDDLPGTTDNPYQVRSIEQFQFINWYALNNEKTVNRVAVPGGGEGYMFLNNWLTGNNERQYSWVQTHDLSGKHITNYTPIAAMQDADPAQTSGNAGKVIAWFSGSYNGNDYTIQDVSISTSDINTTGLFGVTVNAELKNIVLYSPKGDAEITATNSKDNWYAIGGLVGLAANTGNSTRSISNCAVAGYTIIDANQGCAFGGGGVGGLVGICNMALENCTAVTNIQLNYTHGNSQRNIRVGGIAGSCQKSISNCYSGGSITLGDQFGSNSTEKTSLHVGGITGGYFMKTLDFATAEVPSIEAGLVQVNGNKVYPSLVTSFRNCYTYIDVDPAVIAQCTSSYTIGGLGEIMVNGTNSHLANYTNCYYLSEQKNNGALDGNAPGVENCTYQSLSEGDASAKLQKEGFKTVTTQTAGGESLSGRYSFGNDSSLLGWDYPFPTILTQSSDVAVNGIANVHYGDWPLEGIVRPEGALPVNLDLFADYNSDVKNAVKVEKLDLSEGVATGGTWHAESSDSTVATAEIENGQLTITAKAEGSVVVTVTYTVNGKDYPPLKIDVNVTAELHLAAASSPIIALSDGAEVSTVLTLRDRGGKELTALQNDIQLSNFTVEFDPDTFASAQVENSAGGPTLTAVSTAAAGQSQMTVHYDFTYLGKTYSTTSVLNLETTQAEAELTPITFTFAPNAGNSLSITYTGQGGFALKVGEATETVSDLRIVDFEVPTDFSQMLWVEWAKNEDGSEQAGTLSITASPQTYYPAVASIRVQYQFTWRGSTHTMWQEVQVQLNQEETQP